jgi:nifR3 family TIM-barrel protein
MLNWKTIQKPIVALAPMADMSDLPFCLICKQEGAPLMFREMVSSEAIVRLNPKTLKMAESDSRERPLIQQIFGSDPATMAEAARIVEERFHPDGIDINMGCPVYNIVSNFNGAFLIKEPARATAIIKAMKAVITVPLSVKTRLGWKNDTDCLEFVKVLEDAGADLISMHGRTKEQGYSGKANWDRIGEARRRVPNVPFLVNGDITTPELAKEALEKSGADGVLLGRGGLGNPWFFKRVETYLKTGIKVEEPSLEERIAVVKQHARLHVAHYGERGLVKLRKHLPWYFKGSLACKDIRSQLVQVSSLEDLDRILNDMQKPVIEQRLPNPVLAPINL